MASVISEQERQTFAGIADVLIPAAEGMPSATEMDVHGGVTDRLLGLRPDLMEPFKRGCATAVDKDPQTASEWLNAHDTEALSAIGLVASAAYYMHPEVRNRLGYPGQENRPADPDETPEYVANGMLKEVQDRGAIYRKA